MRYGDIFSNTAFSNLDEHKFKTRMPSPSNQLNEDSFTSDSDDQSDIPKVKNYKMNKAK